MVEVSVVVPSREPRESIEAIAALERDAFDDYEVLVPDESPVTAARNRGVEAAAADKLVFLDDDSRPREGYLARAVEMLDRERAVAGRTVHPRDDAFARLAAHYDFGDEPRYVTRFWGCNMALRRDVLDAVGGWNEAMGWGHEEKELAERVLRECPIYYDPDLVVEHAYADSIREYWAKQYALETQTPRYWDAIDVPERDQWVRIGRTALTPTNYLGASLEHTLARAGGTLAGTAGRLRGMLAGRRRRARPGGG